MKNWFKIQAKGKIADIYIYDEIGSWGIKAKDFILALKNAGTFDEIALHINSPGGDTFEAFSIYDSLMNGNFKISTHIEGLAASAASFIALTGEKRTITKNSRIMIHFPWAMVAGNSSELEKYVELLKSLNEQFIALYSERTGISTGEIEKMLKDETWLTPADAVDKGFCTEIAESMKVAASASLPRYNYPDNQINEIYNQNNEGGAMKEILQALGVQTEAEALPVIQTMKTENADLKTKLTQANAKINENIVAIAIAEGKLLPAQKDFAVKLLNSQGIDTFNEYVSLQANTIQTLKANLVIQSPGAGGTESPYEITKQE